MADPYSQGKAGHFFYHDKVDIYTSVAVVLDGMLDDRGLDLIKPISRAFPKHSIIELIGTDEESAVPGGSVQRICYLGFLVLKNSGVLLTGDAVIWNSQTIGYIAGYDDTHMPNHQNTIVKMEKRMSGKNLGLKINDEIIIKNRLPGKM